MNDWPHAPVHRFSEAGTYFVTGSTYMRTRVYEKPAELDLLQELVFEKAKIYECDVQSWSIFSNHYHLVLSALVGDNIRSMLTRLHTDAAIEINRRQGTPGRKVWFQFRDTLLTYERSWLARLRYTNENPVHHGLVDLATRYRWCSARWFEDTAQPSLIDTLRKVKIDRVNVYDPF